MADGKTLVNVSKCIVTNERSGTSFDIGDTASEIQVEPILSQGKRDILRVKNKILGINETEDIVIGYKLKLKDNTFNLDVMRLVDGGTLSGSHYTSIPAGQVVQKDLFTLTVYCEEKDYNRTIGYTKFTWKHCKGKVPKYKVQDGNFIVPEFDAESIPFRGETSVDIDSVSSLPSGGGSTGGNTGGNTGGAMTGVVGGNVSKSNTDVGIEITSNIKWKFMKPVDPREIDPSHFKVTKKSDASVVSGDLTIDSTNKIVTFVPTSIEAATTYNAAATAVDLLDGSGTTTAISVDFTTL